MGRETKFEYRDPVEVVDTLQGYEQVLKGVYLRTIASGKHRCVVRLSAETLDVLDYDDQHIRRDPDFVLMEVVHAAK